MSDREPVQTQAETTWEREAGGALPEGRLISTISAASGMPSPAPAPAEANGNGNKNGQLADGPDWQNDPVEVVLDAIERGTDLVIVYAGAQGTTCRQITPYDLEGAVIRAYCHMRGEERSFWLASIQEAVPLD